MPPRSRRAYDHRIKQEIVRAGDPDLFPDLEIPRSTATSWIHRGLGVPVCSLMAAFQGQTPDEVYFGRGAHVPDDLAVARREARQRRVELNQAVACTACPRTALTTSEDIAA